MTVPEVSGLKGSSSQVFMIRFWPEDLGDGRVDWRGRVQHGNSGEVTYFRDWLILEKFIQGYLRGFPTVEVHEEGQHDPSGKPPLNP
jgi:hypothetical protein